VWVSVTDLLGTAWIGGALGVIGVVLAVVGLGTGYYFYKRSIRQPILKHYTWALDVVGGFSHPVLEGMEVIFKGASVHRLTASTITLWNAGNATLDRDAIAQRDPIRIQLRGEGRILEATVTKSTGAANNVSLDLDDEGGVVLIGFDFLDPQDGAVVRVLHTSPERYPEVRGVLKGAQLAEAIRLRSITPFIAYRTLRLMLLMTAILMALAAFIPDSLYASLATLKQVSAQTGALPLGARLALLVLALSQGYYAWRLFQFGKTPIPSKLSD
jgi:hypothetical protein